MLHTASDTFLSKSNAHCDSNSSLSHAAVSAKLKIKKPQSDASRNNLTASIGNRSSKEKLNVERSLTFVQAAEN